MIIFSVFVDVKALEMIVGVVGLLLLLLLTNLSRVDSRGNLLLRGSTAEIFMELGANLKCSA